MKDVICPNGWDGTVMNRGILQCSPGIYFYVIKALAKNDKDTYIGNRGKEKTKITEGTDIINHPEETKGIIIMFPNEHLKEK